MKKRFSLTWCAVLLLVFLGSGTSLNRVEAKSGQNEGAYKTKGSIAEGPLQIGCWHPVWHVEALPEYVFPMVYLRWPRPNRHPDFTVKQFAFNVIEEIKTRPPNQPIWFMFHAWMGDYKPGWDKTNVICHEKDATPAGTPGIWPDEGVKDWAAKTTELLSILKNKQIRLDFWPMDHEAWVNEWAHNFAHPWNFKNVVKDPRWKTKEILGTGITGSQILDPDTLEDEDPVWKRTHTHWKDLPDHRKAFEAAALPALYMRNTALNQAYVEPLKKFYPHVDTSDYNHGKKKMEDVLGGHWSASWVWEKMKKINPALADLPGVGNVDSRSLYGGKNWIRKGKALGGDQVDAMLKYVDERIAVYGADKVAPWITVPTFGSKGKRNMSKSEYRRLMLGMAERGISRYINWNPVSISSPEANQEMVSVFKEMYEILKKKKAAAQ